LLVFYSRPPKANGLDEGLDVLDPHGFGGGPVIQPAFFLIIP